MEYSIGEIGKQLCLTADTLRYYEKIRLIPKPGRDSGGRRFYTQKDISRLRFVQRAQQMGFTLREIGQLLKFRENPLKASQRVRRLAQRKYEDISVRLAETKHLHEEFSLLLKLCSGDTESCPILDTLESTHD